MPLGIIRDKYNLCEVNYKEQQFHSPVAGDPRKTVEVE